MTTTEFEQSVLRTWKRDDHRWIRVAHAALGLGEAGEVQGEIKKALFYGGNTLAAREQRLEEWKPKLLDELGDQLYYITAELLELGYNLDDCMQYNSRKLQARYPNGFVPGGGIRDDVGADVPGGGAA